MRYFLLIFSFLLGISFCYGSLKLKKAAPLNALFLALLGGATTLISGWALFYLVVFYFS